MFCADAAAGVTDDFPAAADPRFHFGSGADQQDTGSAAVCLGEDVPAAGGGDMADVIAAVKDRYVLPAGLVRAAGPDHVEPGDVPKRGKLLDRLMGRPGPTTMRISCASRLGLRDLLAETVMFTASAAPPGQSRPGAATTVGAGFLGVWGHYLLSASTRRSISSSTLPVLGSSFGQLVAELGLGPAL